MVKTYQLRPVFHLKGERFDIRDDRERVVYHVEGSFLTVPKIFTILDAYGQEVARISRPLLPVLGRFQVIFVDGQAFTIRKQLRFWQDTYVCEDLPLLVEGHLLDKALTLKTLTGEVAATITKGMVKLTSTFTLTVYDESLTDQLVAFLVACHDIDRLENHS